MIYSTESLIVGMRSFYYALLYRSILEVDMSCSSFLGGLIKQSTSRHQPLIAFHNQNVNIPVSVRIPSFAFFRA